MKVEIKNRWTAVVLAADIPDDTPEQWHVKVALETMVNAGANLQGADLHFAELMGVNLRGASLRGADLLGADLRHSDLRGVDLYLADLRLANLHGARLGGAELHLAKLAGSRLDGADLRGADLYGKKLVGARPVVQLGPIGSRADSLVVYLTDAGVMIHANCFFGTLTAFAAAVSETHGDNEHGREYRAAIAYIEAHAAIWTPAAVEAA